MPSETFRCQLCDTHIQYRANYCVYCYRKMHHACPNCMKLGADSIYRPRKAGKPPKPVDCSVCLNDRWVLYHPTKGLLSTDGRQRGTLPPSP